MIHKKFIVRREEGQRYHILVGKDMHDVIQYLAEKHHTTITDMANEILQKGLVHYLPKNNR